MQNILDSILKKGAPDDFRVLLESQLSNSKIGLEKRKTMGSKSYKHMFVNKLPFTSANQDLGASGMLILPSKRLLQFYKNSVPQAPGIVDENFQWMVKEAD